MEPHPKGSNARVLLSSVFGPYAQDDEFGSRAINPMELYHNQVTRAQGSFSLRMFHRSWGIMMLQANIKAPCTVLDFPTREDFIRELRAYPYDIVGLSSIIVNLGKVKEMCRLVREVSPNSTIVVGGHVAAVPGIETMIDADHIVKGEGIAWLRRYLGEDEHAPVNHPAIVSGLQTRVMGLRLPEREGGTAATIIPSVGCPMGCNFCTTSAFFGGKGKFVNFYETGDELFDVMCCDRGRFEGRLVLHHGREFPATSHPRHATAGAHEGKRTRAGHSLCSLPPTRSANTPWRNWSNWASHGYGWAWNLPNRPMPSYRARTRCNLRANCASMASGCKAPRSSDWSITRRKISNKKSNTRSGMTPIFTSSCSTLRSRALRCTSRWPKKDGCLNNIDPADIHGQFKFNFRHAAISRDDSKKFLDRAFRRDFERNGPSLYRICRTMLEGWKRYKQYPDPRVRERFSRDMAKLGTAYNGMLWAMERSLKKANRQVSQQIHLLRKEINHEFGYAARLTAEALGPSFVFEFAPRGAQVGARQDLRASDDYRADELDYRLNPRASPGIARFCRPASALPDIDTGGRKLRPKTGGKVIPPRSDVDFCTNDCGGAQLPQSCRKVA